MNHQTKGWLEVRPWRPHVVAVACYLAVFSIFGMWVLCSLRLDQYADMVLTPRYFGLSLWQILSVMNVAWLVLLGLDLVMEPRSRGGLRRTHLAGAVVAVVAVIVLQLAVFSLRDGAECWVERRGDSSPPGFLTEGG